MARALQAGWDQPANPPGAGRPGWAAPVEPRRQPQQEGDAGSAVVRSSSADDEEDERPFREILWDTLGAIGGTLKDSVGGFCAAWFGAVHLQHLSAEDVELDMPKSEAAKAIGTGVLSTGNTWSSNFQRVNPKRVQHGNFTGKYRTKHGWAGEPEMRPEAAGYYQHTYSATAEPPTLTRQYLPWFTCLQILFCLGLWLIFHWKDGTQLAGMESIWPDKTDLALQHDCVDYRTEVWRWWTYQYSHIGISHIGFNCFMTFFFGVPLEGLQGTWRMFVMFNVGVFGGACCCFVADPHSRVVGMSGGCYALIGMHFGDVLMNFTEQARAASNWKTLSEEERKSKKAMWRKMIISPRAKIIALVLLVTIDLVQGYLTRGNGVSLSAHFGGFVAGFLICVVIGHNLVVKGYERLFWGAAFLTGAALITFSMLWGLRWPPRDIFEQVPWCWGRQIANITAFGDNRWHCVRCPDVACIERWHIQRYIATVTDRMCQNNGGWDVTDG